MNTDSMPRGGVTLFRGRRALSREFNSDIGQLPSKPARVGARMVEDVEAPVLPRQGLCALILRRVATAVGEGVAMVADPSFSDRRAVKLAFAFK